MRTYKFRAWNGTKMLLSENAEFYLIPNNKVQVPSPTGHEFYDKDYPIMQFTGLHDINGVEIFEYMEIDNFHEVSFVNGEYILTNISNGDTISLYKYMEHKDGSIEVTREYTKI